MNLQSNKNAVVYIHGKGGNSAEAEHYRSLFPDYDIIGFDYKSQTPWEAKAEFPAYFYSLSEKYESVILIANSIGAYFAINADIGKAIQKAFFISPVVDMEKLILNMMSAVNVTEDELKEKGAIQTDYGETLSWDYLTYAREDSFKWNVPTKMLYGDNDNIVDFETIKEFAQRINARLTVMEGGEHWFHTVEQMRFLDRWIKEGI